MAGKKKSSEVNIVIRKPRGTSVEKAIREQDIVKRITSHIKRIKGK